MISLPYFCCMQFYLLQASDVNSAANYLPIGIQLIFAIGFIGTMMALTHYFGPKRKGTDKLQNFESGIEIKGNARQPMAIKYFLVAILFVLFDVEVIFFYPYAVNFRELGWKGFVFRLGPSKCVTPNMVNTKPPANSSWMAMGK